MKAIRILNRSIRDAFKSVFRNFSLSIASITCIAITLVLVAASLVLSSNVNQFTKDIENELSIVVYLKEDVDSSKRNEIENDIKKMSSYQSHVFKSKDDWKKEMRESLGQLNTILDDMEENPLLDSIISRQQLKLFPN